MVSIENRNIDLRPMMGRRQEIARKAEELSKRHDVHFTKQECERALQLFQKFAEPTAEDLKVNKVGIDRQKFRSILNEYFQLNNDLLMDQIFKAFAKENDRVKDMDWTIGLSVFLKGKLEEQVKFCFDVYQLKRDEPHISKETTFQHLKNAIVQSGTDEDLDEGPKDLVDYLFKHMDMDHDGRISLNDYLQAVKQESLWLEALGECLPKREQRDVFLQLLSDDTGHGYR